MCFVHFSFLLIHLPSLQPSLLQRDKIYVNIYSKILVSLKLITQLPLTSEQPGFQLCTDIWYETSRHFSSYVCDKCIWISDKNKFRKVKLHTPFKKVKMVSYPHIICRCRNCETCFWIYYFLEITYLKTFAAATTFIFWNGLPLSCSFCFPCVQSGNSKL